MIKGVIFDVDGVLLDSLSPHLQFCLDKAKEYKIDAKTPTPEGFKELIRSGVKISPMENFFTACGFTQEQARKADIDYQNNFKIAYTIPVFLGIYYAISTLSIKQYKLGIVTANILENIKSPLGLIFEFFDKKSIFTKDIPGFPDKAFAIKSIIDGWNLQPEQVVYVGDQPSDKEAADKVGTQFLGVTYGWGFNKTDSIVSVNKVSDIPNEIMRSF